jgi:hypothetical protein
VSGGVQAGKQKTPKNNKDKICDGSGDADGDEEKDDDLDATRGKNDTPNSSSESEEEGPVCASANLQSQKQCVLNLDGERARLRKKRPVFNPTLIKKEMGN